MVPPTIPRRAGRAAAPGDQRGVGPGEGPPARALRVQPAASPSLRRAAPVPAGRPRPWRRLDSAPRPRVHWISPAALIRRRHVAGRDVRGRYGPARGRAPPRATERRAARHAGREVAHHAPRPRGRRPRTAAARAATHLRADLIADLGGPDAITAARSAPVELAVRTMLYVAICARVTPAAARSIADTPRAVISMPSRSGYASQRVEADPASRSLPGPPIARYSRRTARS